MATKKSSPGKRWSRMKKRRRSRITSAATNLICFLLCSLAQTDAAEPLKKMRIAIPSIVIDFAPLWIARDKGIFRDERIDAEVTYIQGNVRVVQSLVAGEVQFGIAGTAGAVSARAAGEDVIIVAWPMDRLDYTLCGGRPVTKLSD